MEPLHARCVHLSDTKLQWATCLYRHAGSELSIFQIPLCDIIRFHIRYTIYLIEETPPETFCMRGLDLFHSYLFR